MDQTFTKKKSLLKSTTEYCLLFTVYFFLILFTACSGPVYGKRFDEKIISITEIPTKQNCITEPVILPPLKPLAKPLIIVDPGHGGKDPGTHSLKNPKYQEKVIALDTAKLVKKSLEQMGYAVMLTRTNDVFIELGDRAKFANKRNPKLFVSIHYNSAQNKDADGIEVFYYKSDEDKKRSEESKTLGKRVLNRCIECTAAKSRGVKHGNFAVIRETDMPAILIEGGFLTNAAERKKIKTQAYLKKLASGIAQGINDYIKMK